MFPYNPHFRKPPYELLMLQNSVRLAVGATTSRPSGPPPDSSVAPSRRSARPGPPWSSSARPGSGPRGIPVISRDYSLWIQPYLLRKRLGYDKGGLKYRIQTLDPNRDYSPWLSIIKDISTRIHIHHKIYESMDWFLSYYFCGLFFILGGRE